MANRVIQFTKQNIDGKEIYELLFNLNGKCYGRITDDSQGTLLCIYNGLTNGKLNIEAKSNTKKGK